MQKYFCPICQDELKPDPSRQHTDYACYGGDDGNHLYIHRVKDEQITKIKVRLMEPGGEKLYFKINYDHGFSEIWTKANDTNRNRIDSIFDPDFSDVEKLKTKIRTYLVFS